MAKKRTKLEIIRDILDVLRKKGEVKITHLIYKSNLSNNTIKPYLESLVENKMIELVVNADKKFYRILKKGEVFLMEFNKIKIFSDSFGL